MPLTFSHSNALSYAFFRQTGGSPISNSEMRRAIKLNAHGIIKV